jgi:mRNA-degrading endonuclease RelE of RelBE toxin-antitoxin system
MADFTILWDEIELQNLEYLLTEISQRSPNLANEIKRLLKEKLNQIIKYPYSCEIDALKVNNNGSYRKISIIHIRLVYKIEKSSNSIHIVRVRHAASEPKAY